MSQWYYTSNGAQQGPVSTEQLQSLVGSGQLASSELVWREGMADWLPAAQMPELGGGMAPPPASDPYAGQMAAPYGAAPGMAYPQQTLGYAQAGPIAGQPVPGAVYGGFWWRVLAHFIDYIILWIPNYVAQLPLQYLMADALQNQTPGQMPDAKFWGIAGVGWATQIAIGWLYFTVQESSAAQATLGKRACGLIVTNENGGRLSFGHATGRYFGKMLSFFICGIGCLMVAFDDRKRGLHDQIAKTLVWKKP